MKLLAIRFYKSPLLIMLMMATGWLALRLEVAPGYASPIWPPAGIALAMLLLWGFRLWPLIWIASCLLNLWNGYYAVNQLTPTIVYVAIGVATASTLQTLVAAWMSQRWVGAGAPRLDDAQKILIYVMLIGPLACLIAATSGVGLLWLLGFFTQDSVLFSWCNWWIGDCLGAVLISTLMFCIFAHPRSLWHGRLLTVALPLSSMLVGLLLVFALMSKSENNRLQLQFDSAAAAINKALGESLSSVLSASLSLNSFFLASSAIERNEFNLFANSAMNQNPSIQALAWAPLVEQSTKPRFEQALRDEGFSRFMITEPEAGNGESHIAVKDRAEYFPILYVEPFAANVAAMGFDLNSEPVRNQTLDAARSSGKLSVSPKIKLLTARQTDGLLLFMPLFHPDADTGQVSFKGFTITALRIEQMMAAALQDLQLKGINVLLRDITLASQAETLYGAQQLPQTSLHDYRHAIAFGDRTLEVLVQPEKAFITERTSWLPWIVLLNGLFFTGLLNIYLLSITGRAAMIEALVEERTAALDLANASLKKTYKELEEQEKKLRNMYELSPLGIALVDMQGRLIEFNEAFRAITGYSRKALYALDFKLLSPPKYHEQDALQLNTLLSNGQYGPYEKEFCRQDGSLIPVQLNSMMVQGGDGRDYIWSIVEDITEANANKEILRQSELKYRELFNVSREPVMMVDMTGFLDCNQATLNLFGYQSVAEFCRLHPGELSPAIQEDGNNSLDMANNHLLTAMTVGFTEFEWLHQRADGSVFPAMVSLSRVQLDGQVAVQAVVRDLSERKQVEQALIAAKEAAEAMAKSKAEFLANMSHEIRTPMNAIVGLSLLALNKTVSAEVRDYLEKIHTSSSSLLGILNDILDFSKIDAGKMGIESTSFNLDILLENLLHLFLPKAEEKHLRFTLDVAADVPVNLMGDPLRIQQILANLVGNAIKFTQAGEISLRLRLIELAPSKANIRFSVEDTGIGIAPADLSKLLQPFSQVETSTTRRFGGTGLGLAISHKLLEMMGGQFVIKSELGKGTIFSFDLLLELAAATGRQATPRLRPRWAEGDLSATLQQYGVPLQGARILVVEDNLINQRVVVELLHLIDVDVVVANHGQEAVDIVQRQAFDAVLMDVHMPVMSGIEATEIIRRLPAYQHLPIIALTAGVTQEEQVNCLACGMNGFIAKPINPIELIDLLVKLLGRDEESEMSINASLPQAGESKLKALPGFDFGNVLILLDGDEGLLVSLLHTLHDNAITVQATLDVLLDKQDFQAAHQLIHTLKGSAGNLGAMHLHDAASALDKGLNKGVLDTQVLADFKIVLQQVIDQLQQI